MASSLVAFSMLDVLGSFQPEFSPGECSAEKEALVSELQEQTTVCLSDMMAGLCSKLPYSDSTKQKLVGVISLPLCWTNWLVAHVHQEMCANFHWVTKW